MRVITFSRSFPATHPRKGEPTSFVEKVLKSLDGGRNRTYYPCCCEKCGWIGMSNCCGGGGQIADTGDYFDPTCPKCYSDRLEGELGEFDYMDRYYLSDDDVWPKHHTIRAGHRWKEGDWFSPRVWSGKPYASKQIQFSPDVQIKKVWAFDVVRGYMFINRKCFGKFHTFNRLLEVLAKNDGLTTIEYIQWFDPKGLMRKLRFSGQILCWNESINYQTP